MFFMHLACLHMLEDVRGGAYAGVTEYLPHHLQLGSFPHIR